MYFMTTEKKQEPKKEEKKDEPRVIPPHSLTR